MKKFFTIVGFIFCMNALFASNFYEPEATQQVINDSTVIFYNVDKIEIKQAQNSQVFILNADTDALVITVKGNALIDLQKKGNYKVIASKQHFSGTKAITKYEYVYF